MSEIIALSDVPEVPNVTVVLSIISVFVVLFGMRCYNFKTGQCICSDKYVGCDCNKKNN